MSPLEATSTPFAFHSTAMPGVLRSWATNAVIASRPVCTGAFGGYKLPPSAKNEANRSADFVVSDHALSASINSFFAASRSTGGGGGWHEATRDVKTRRGRKLFIGPPGASHSGAAKT